MTLPSGWSFFGDEIDRISEVTALTGERRAVVKHVAIFPASHYIVPKEKMQEAIRDIQNEMSEQVKTFTEQGKLIERSGLPADYV